MNWDALGAIAETTSAVGVIATLVYLATQIRSAARQNRGQAFISLEQKTHSIVHELRNNPELLDLVLRANADWKSLDEREKVVAHLWNMDEAQLYETAWVLWQQGAIDEETYLSREEYFLSLTSAPGRALWWTEYTFVLDPRFRARINQQLKKANPNDFYEKFPFTDPSNQE